MIDFLAALVDLLTNPNGTPPPKKPAVVRKGQVLRSLIKSSHAVAWYAPSEPMMPGSAPKPVAEVAIQPQPLASVEPDLPIRAVLANSQPTPSFPATPLLPALAVEVLPKLTQPRLIPPKPVTSSSSAVRIVAPANKRKMEDIPCSLVLSEAPLHHVLSLLAEQAKVNIVLLAPTESKVTVRLVKVRLEDAMRHLSAITGLSFLNVENAYVMGQADRLKAAYPAAWLAAYPEPELPKPTESATTSDSVPPTQTVAPVKAPVLRIYPVNHVDPKSLEETLNALFKDSEVAVVVGPKPKSPDLTQASSNTGGDASGTMTGSTDRVTRMLILRGPQEAVEQALETARSLDSPRAQVSIAVQIYDVSDDALRDLGVVWTPGGTTVSEIDPKGINFGSFTRTNLAFNAAIKAAEQKDKAKILAKPDVLVMDQERAFVLIGSKINLPRLERLDSNGSPVFTSVEYRAGIYLQVAPSISSDGTITLSLYPQVSTITGTNEINGASYPNISTREAQTTLQVRSGETIVMGGLLRDEEIREMERVPILGQIPLFGELFTRRRTAKNKSQVIISITPLLISGKAP